MEKDKDDKGRRMTDAGAVRESPAEIPATGLSGIVPRQDTPKKFMVPRRLK